MKTTLDGILNRRITLEQPAEGFRVAVDTVLLAAAVPAREGQTVLEFGCGVGGAMLALACRVPDVAITGLEIQPELAALAATNIKRNGFASHLCVREGDATHLPSEWQGAFNHVMMNPPYHDRARHDVSVNSLKRRANTEEEGELVQWIASAAGALREGGCLTLIHRADRWSDLGVALQAWFGRVWIKPVLPKPEAAPKRVLIRAEKGGSFQATEVAPLILHQADGAYSAAAEKILREVGAVEGWNPLPLAGEGRAALGREG